MRSIGAIFYIMLFALQAGAASITAYTEELPPFGLTRDGKPSGLSTELLQAMCAEAKIECEIRIVPWARAFHEALNRPNTLVFSTARIASREASFVWIGPITANVHNVIYARGDFARPAATLNDLQGLRVGVVNKDAGHDEMVRAGVSGVTFEAGPNVQSNLRKLMAGHIDVMPAQEIVMAWAMRVGGLDDKSVIPLFSFGVDADLYFAINPRSDPALVEALRAAWTKISATSLPQEIKLRYLPDLK